MGRMRGRSREWMRGEGAMYLTLRILLSMYPEEGE